MMVAATDICKALKIILDVSDGVSRRCDDDHGGQDFWATWPGQGYRRETGADGLRREVVGSTGNLRPGHVATGVVRRIVIAVYLIADLNALHHVGFDSISHLGC